MANQDTSFFGRKKGRPLNKSRAEAIEKLLPFLRVDDALLTQDGTLIPSSLFKNPYQNIIFEIGFGSGERLAEHLQREPETGFIGAEPFINGMAAFLKSLLDRHPDQTKCVEGSSGLKDGDPSAALADAPFAQDDVPPNIRVFDDDAMIVAKSLQDQSLDAIYVLNPDPWHKTRHHKRRIINPDNLDVFSRILKPGGWLIMTTDVPYLAEWMLTHAMNHPGFEWTARRADDFRLPPKDWIHTRYETKRAKGASKMSYLVFERK